MADPPVDLNSINTPRRLDFLSVFLLLIAQITAAFQLVATGWADDLYIAINLALFGVVLGLFLGLSTFSLPSVVLLGVLYGAVAIPWQLGLPFERGMPWLDRYANLFDLLTDDISQLIKNEDVVNPVLFLTLMAILVWWLSVHAGYNLARYQRPWPSILPAGVAMMVIFSFGYLVSLSSWYLATYIFFALLLVARLTFISRNTRWQRSRLRLPLNLNLDISRTALILVLVLVIFAWNIPAIAATAPAAIRAWNDVTGPLAGVRERIGKAFAPLQASVLVVHGYYDNRLSLGRGQSRSGEVVMQIEAPEPPSPAVRYYWRAHHYDYYEDGQWYSTLPLSTEELPEAYDATQPQYAGRWETTVKVTTNRKISTLYTPSQPAWVSRPFRPLWFEEAEGVFDFIALHAQTQLDEGDTYSARSYLSNLTSSELRAAGTDYPTAISDHYLQLPGSITPRTFDLAEAITADLETPYDKVVAVTEYLRKNINYADSVPRLPRNQEPVDWLLFDLQEGFCNYYATAEVVLLRAVGVPARWAVGYAQGQPSEKDGEALTTYSVRYENSHSWPEVYFPGYGWIEFEPTANQDPLVRPVGGDLPNDMGNLPITLQGDADSQQDEFTEEEEYLEEKRDQDLTNLGDSSAGLEGLPIPWEFLLTLGGIGLLLLGWRTFRRRGGSPLPVLVETGMLQMDISPPNLLRSWSRLASLSPVERAYQEINLILSGLNAKPKITDTPAVRIANLIKILPAVEKPAQILLQEYQNSYFGPMPGRPYMIRSAVRTIRNQAYKPIILNFFENVKNKLTPKRFRRRT
jgi:transglutaminase-like putative cysteine protease